MDSRIRLVAVDLDGTLLDDRKKVSGQTAEALRSVAGDVRIVIASARPPRGVRHIYQGLGLLTPQVNYNGALIWDEPARRVIRHAPIAGNLVCRLIGFARDRHPTVVVASEILDRWHTDRDDPAHTTETGRLFPPDVVCPVAQFGSLDTTKLMFLAGPAVVDDLAGAIRACFSNLITVIRTDSNLLQLTHPAAGKRAAVEWLAQSFGVSRAEVLAIGDAENDVEMIEWAGVGVAMGNATTDAKAAADWVAPDNNDHGVLAALVRFGLCEPA